MMEAVSAENPFLMYDMITGAKDANP